MSRTYSHWTCPLCKETMSGNGLSKYNHQMKHVRKGEMKRMVDRFVFNGIVRHASYMFVIVRKDSL